jgi:prepilin-type N-terminal cleavage/methylation domain-containing protein/prepilin-type processing-associated H-X9-DG protein
MKRRAGFSLVEFLVVLAIIVFLISLLLPALARSREAARRIVCVNNLKQIALALQTYYTANEVLPSGATDHRTADEEEQEVEGDRIGWIASLLPNAEQMGLYQSIDFGRGALDPVNYKVRTTTISMVLCPSSDRGRWAHGWWNPSLSPTPPPAAPVSDGISTYAGCHHDVEAPIGLDDRGVFYRNSRVRYEDVTDGLSQTLFIGEVADPSPLGWLSGSRATLRNTGHPINAQSGRASDAASVSPGFVGGFGSSHGAGANVAMGDGSVRFLLDSIDASVLRLLGNRSDGEAIDESNY